MADEFRSHVIGPDDPWPSRGRGEERKGRSSADDPWQRRGRGETGTPTDTKREREKEKERREDVGGGRGVRARC